MSRPVPEGWLIGSPVDPTREPPEAFEPTPGFPFTYLGSCVVFASPTGIGKSALGIACAHDAAEAGLRVLILGSEITEGELNYRARKLAEHRGDPLDGELVQTWERVRYVALADTLRVAWSNPDEWRRRVEASYDVVIIDPLSSAASALRLDFIQSDTDFNAFYDGLIEPLRNAGKVVVILDNIGHADEAKHRPKGASAKVDRPDIVLAGRALEPPALLVTCEKARSERCPFNVGDSWTFDDATRRLLFVSRGVAPPVERIADPDEKAAVRQAAIETDILTVCRDQALDSFNKVYVAVTALKKETRGEKHGWDRNDVRSAFNGFKSAGRLLKTSDGYREQHHGSITAPSQPPGLNGGGGMEGAHPVRSTEGPASHPDGPSQPTLDMCEPEEAEPDPRNGAAVIDEGAEQFMADFGEAAS